MTASEAHAKLKAENATGPLTDRQYEACIAAQLSPRQRKAWRAELRTLRRDHYAGKRPCADEALRRCQAKAAKVFSVGGASKWRSA